MSENTEKEAVEEVTQGLEEATLEGEGQAEPTPGTGEVGEEKGAEKKKTPEIVEPSAADKPDLSGYYEHVKTENFENFLAAYGANFLVRKMAAASSPDLEIKQVDDHFVIKLMSTFINKETEFTIGEEFIDKQPNGVELKAVGSWEEDRLVLKMTPLHEGKGHPLTITRQLKDKELTVIARPKPTEPTVSNMDLENPFTGKYKHVRDENFDGVLAAIGVPYLMRKVATRTHPDVEIEQDGDKFDFKMISTFFTQRAEFTVGGDEFEAKLPTGAVNVCKATWEDAKLKIVSKGKKEGSKEEISYRELIGDELHIFFLIGDVTGKRIFVREAK